MIVDAQRHAAFETQNGMAGEVDLADRGGSKCRNVDQRIPTVIAGADVDVVDVAQDAAAGARGHRRQKLPFGNGGVAITQVRGGIFDEYRTSQVSLGLVDMT